MFISEVQQAVGRKEAMKGGVPFIERALVHT